MRYFKLIGILAIHFGQDLNMRLRWFSLYCFKTKQNSKNTRRVPLAGKSTTVFFCFSLFFFFFMKAKPNKKTKQTKQQRTCAVSGPKHDTTFFFFCFEIVYKKTNIDYMDEYYKYWNGIMIHKHQYQQRIKYLLLFLFFFFLEYF